MVAEPEGDVLEVDHVLAEPGRGHPFQREPVPRRGLVGDEGRGRVEPEARLARPRRRTPPQPGELLAQQVRPPLLGHDGDPGPLGTREDVRGVPAS